LDSADNPRAPVRALSSVQAPLTPCVDGSERVHPSGELVPASNEPFKSWVRTSPLADEPKRTRVGIAIRYQRKERFTIKPPGQANTKYSFHGNVAREGRLVERRTPRGKCLARDRSSLPLNRSQSCQPGPEGLPQLLVRELYSRTLCSNPLGKVRLSLLSFRPKREILPRSLEILSIAGMTRKWGLD